MSIEQLLGHTTEQLEAMSVEERLVKFKPVFDLEAKLIAEGATKIIPEEPEEEPGEGEEYETKLRVVKPKDKISKLDKTREKLKADMAMLLQMQKEISEMNKLKTT